MNISLNQTKKKLLDLLEQSITSRTKDKSKKYGLLFSGGVDSCLLAMLLKKQNIKFTCFFAYVKDTTEAKDLAYAKKAAKELDLKLEIISCEKKYIPKIISEIITSIDSTNPIKVGIAIPGYLSCKKAKEKGINVIFSGLGSDELFAGYSKFKDSKDIKKETKKCLDNLQEDNLSRDEAIAEHFGITVDCPYLDKGIINYALTINPKFLLSETKNKIVIREITNDLGLSKELAERKKVACQYGSNSDRVIEKLTKENKFKTKTDYLSSFERKKQIKIGALYSGGKDSNLSLWLMQKQNYDISCLISLIPDNKDSYMFQTPELEFLKLQSIALNIPLLITKTKGEKEKELTDLKKAITSAKQEYGITGIVAGALYSVYQKERIENICLDLGLKLYAPLWHMKEVDEIKLLLDNNFKFIICKIAALGMAEKFLGKIIDKKDLEELKKLNQKYKLNIAGEGGEYETLVLNGPSFKQQIKISSSKKILQNEFTGYLDIKKATLEKK
ncbi:MAG: diphthine--ammonia ligase [archaeon]|jgi:asparagine synthase (glutamine-hydrolysing)